MWWIAASVEVIIGISAAIRVPVIITVSPAVIVTTGGRTSPIIIVTLIWVLRANLRPMSFCTTSETFLFPSHARLLSHFTPRQLHLQFLPLELLAVHAFYNILCIFGIFIMSKGII
jgi:hypothetical protein